MNHKNHKNWTFVLDGRPRHRVPSCKWEHPSLVRTATGAMGRFTGTPLCLYRWCMELPSFTNPVCIDKRGDRFTAALGSRHVVYTFIIKWIEVYCALFPKMLEEGFQHDATTKTLQQGSDLSRLGSTNRKHSRKTPTL